MITKQQALTENHFHVGNCTRVVGPKGGVKVTVAECRRNGATKTWVTRPEEFRLPVKRGLRDYGYITDGDNARFHLPEDCPILEEE